MTNSSKLLLTIALALPAATGCGGDASSPDAGATDASSALDAGPRDPSAEPTLAVPCDDTVDDVYAATPDTSEDALAARGRILACAYERYDDVATLEGRLAEDGTTGITVAHGMHVFRVAFQTTRGDGSAAVSSARVFLPDGYARTPSPMVVAAHGTAGLADVCAPSAYDTAQVALTLSWPALGWPVIAPDYAGLGTAGVQGYGDNTDTAHSQLDAARAFRALLPTGTLTDDIVMTGHSQGGGVVLSAQALAASYGTGGTLRVVIPFAPGWPIDTDVTGYRYPSIPTSFSGGVPASLSALYLYAFAANHLGEGHEGDVFGADARDAVVDVLDSACISTLPTAIPATAATFGDLVDADLRTGLLACADGDTAACTGNGALLWAFMNANVLAADGDGAPIVEFQGTADTTVPPAKTACVNAHLVEGGVTPTVCVDASEHGTVVRNNIASAIAFASAIVDGTALPACPSTDATLPACE